MKRVEYELLSEALLLRASSGSAISPEEIILISKASSSKSIEIIKDICGKNIGYILWSSVNKYSVSNFITNSVFPKYYYESNEGKICCILNIFILRGRGVEAIKGIRDFVKKRRVVVYIKKNRANYLLRVKNKFFKKVNKDYFMPNFETKRTGA